MLLHTNNAAGTLSGAIASGDTTINLTAGHGARFPAANGAGNYFYATLIDNSNNIEIIKVTNRSTDALTAVRGQDGTTARAYSSGDRIELRWCRADILAALQEAIQAVVAAGADTFTGALSPVPTAYNQHQVYCVRFPASNTVTNPTINLSSLGTKTIKKGNSEALALLDIPALGYAFLAYNGADMILMNPANVIFPNWSTGDVKLTYKTVADVGWVLMNDGTIGNAASGATTRANADTADLFAHFWNNIADAQCAVSGGRGANAAADFAANKTIALPKALGRALAVYGTGAGLSSRVLGFTTGEERHTLTAAETPVLAAQTVKPYQPGTGFGPYKDPTDANTGAGLEVINPGGGGSHENVPPETFLNAEVKL